jgi:acetoin utilization protein AcuC
MVRVYFGDALGDYGFGQDHPFGPDRIYAFWTETVKQGLDKKVDIGMPSICAKNDLIRFHTQQYVDKVYRLSKNGEGYLDNGDTPAFKGMFEAASYVVGAGLDGLNEVIQGDDPRVFVPIAGLHHASRNSAAGFCVFNDAGILIETLRREFGIKRIAYVDIDAHHGDGVYYAFEDDPD